MLKGTIRQHSHDEKQYSTTFCMVWQFFFLRTRVRILVIFLTHLVGGVRILFESCLARQIAPLPAQMICRPRLPSNGDLPSNYGRTSPPAKTVFAHARPEKLHPPARRDALAGGRFFGGGHLIMAIYPLTMAGLAPLPKRCLHMPGLTNRPRQRVSLRWQGGDLSAEAT